MRYTYLIKEVPDHTCSAALINGEIILCKVGHADNMTGNARQIILQEKIPSFGLEDHFLQYYDRFRKRDGSSDDWFLLPADEYKRLSHFFYYFFDEEVRRSFDIPILHHMSHEVLMKESKGAVGLSPYNQKVLERHIKLETYRPQLIQAIIDNPQLLALLYETHEPDFYRFMLKRHPTQSLQSNECLETVSNVTILEEIPIVTQSEVQENTDQLQDVVILDNDPNLLNVREFVKMCAHVKPRYIIHKGYFNDQYYKYCKANGIKLKDVKSAGTTRAKWMDRAMEMLGFPTHRGNLCNHAYAGLLLVDMSIPTTHKSDKDEHMPTYDMPGPIVHSLTFDCIKKLLQNGFIDQKEYLYLTEERRVYLETGYPYVKNGKKKKAENDSPDSPFERIPNCSPTEFNEYMKLLEVRLEKLERRKLAVKTVVKPTNANVIAALDKFRTTYDNYYY
ncbi:MAG: hypothetical protein ACMG6E_01530 [Candidatus Roizmanbacteria bacterium]